MIPDSLQHWVYEFLDKPASDTGLDFTVGHVLSSDMLAQVSVREIYDKNDSSLTYLPHYFAHINQATQDMTRPHMRTDDVRIAVSPADQQNRIEITLNIPRELLPDYLE